MYTVVLPINTQDHALEDAIYFVKSLPGEISVVVTHSRKDIDIVGSDGGRVSIDHEDFEIPDAFEGAVSALTEAGLDVTKDVRVGEATEQIVEAIRDHDADQLVLPARKRSPVGKAIFGSRTLDLIHDSPVPVTIVTEQWTNER
ncbi:universal stress protein [Halorubrum sp. DTA46]|uniref:universal stress protein n=1 Tax=Halorubrum sp. DTA46 TaxID=3402162 RepID=UPI003AB0CB31